MKPTPAQKRYLENALKVCDAGTGKYNCFLLIGPGRKRTGLACYRRGWLDQYTAHVYRITPAGRAVLENQS